MHHPDVMSDNTAVARTHWHRTIFGDPQPVCGR
jgi:hypothetical protein